MITKPRHHSIPNITRFDYDRTAFQGWRVCKTISGVTYTRYVPDKAHPRSRDRAAASLAVAKRLLRQLGAKFNDASPGGFQTWIKENGFTVSRPTK